MINTGGFQTSVLPQYTPVDANLAAFNPAQAMAGAGQAFDVMKGLEDLKLMRQTHEENAKMSAAKNKLLEAQAVREGLLADYEAGMFSDKLTADKAEAAARKVGAEGKVATTPGATEATLRAQKTATALAPGDERLALGNQNMLIGAQPFISQATINKAQFDQEAAREALSTQGTRQDIARASLDSEMDNLFPKLEKERLTALADVQKAKLSLKDAQRQFDAGLSDATAIANANLANTLAETRVRNADAKRKELESTPEYVAAKQKFEQVDSAMKQYKDITAIARSVGSTMVNNPTTGVAVPLSTLVDSYFDYDRDGNEIKKDDSGWFNTTKYLNATQLQDAAEYRAIKFDQAQAAARVRALRGPVKSTVDNANVPVYGMRPNGTYGIINQSPTIVNQ